MFVVAGCLSRSGRAGYKKKLTSFKSGNDFVNDPLKDAKKLKEE